jgi:hypothetical protein
MKTKIEMYCLNFIYRTLLPVQDYTSNAHAHNPFLQMEKKTIDFFKCTLTYTHILMTCLHESRPNHFGSRLGNYKIKYSAESGFPEAFS